MKRPSLIVLIIGCVLALGVWGYYFRKHSAPLVISDARPATADELKHVLKDLPAGYLTNINGTDEEKARELGLKILAFDYSGGPFYCWLETKETGQSTFSPRLPGDKPEVTWAGADAPSGRILLWIASRVAPDMPAELADARRNNADIPNFAFGLDINGKPANRTRSNPGVLKPFVPLWFGWNQPQITERKAADPELQQAEAQNIWEITATETGGENRKIVMRLNARKNK